jgi:hypothetical protein
MESLEDEVLEILSRVQEGEHTAASSKKLYDELLEALAAIAVKNGIDKVKFFEEAEKIMPFDFTTQLNDDASEEGFCSASGSDKKKKERFWSNLDKVTKILRFINASYRFVKNVSDCLGAIDSD